MTKKNWGITAQLVLGPLPCPLPEYRAREEVSELVIGAWSFVGHWCLVIGHSPGKTPIKNRSLRSLGLASSRMMPRRNTRLFFASAKSRVDRKQRGANFPALLRLR
jgi:hypothetical protein